LLPGVCIAIDAAAVPSTRESSLKETELPGLLFGIERPVEESLPEVVKSRRWTLEPLSLEFCPSFGTVGK
jgi:hypothetical protein